jgi:acetolactate synthase regulatory subunit
MSYIIEVSMQDREGAVARLIMLFSQRHLDIVQFSAKRSGAGMISATIEVEGPRERAPWTLRQVARNHNVVTAYMPNPGEPKRARVMKKDAESMRRYPVRGRSLNGQRTLMVRRDSRLAAAKS